MHGGKQEKGKTMTTQEKPKRTKTASVFLSDEELQHLDECAKRSGLCRSKYLRLIIKQSCPYIDVDKLDEITAISRRIEQRLQWLIKNFESLQDQCAEEGIEDAAESIATFSKSANSSLKLLCKEQKAAAKIMKNLWRLSNEE